MSHHAGDNNWFFFLQNIFQIVTSSHPILISNKFASEREKKFISTACVLHELWVCHIKWPLRLPNHHHPLSLSRHYSPFIRLANIKFLSKSTKTKTKVSYMCGRLVGDWNCGARIRRRWQSSVLSINVDWGVTISSWESRWESKQKKEDLNHLCRYIKWNKVWITASVEQHLSSIAPFLSFPLSRRVCVTTTTTMLEEEKK